MQVIPDFHFIFGNVSGLCVFVVPDLCHGAERFYVAAAAGVEAPQCHLPAEGFPVTRGP